MDTKTCGAIAMLLAVGCGDGDATEETRTSVESLSVSQSGDDWVVKNAMGTTTIYRSGSASLSESWGGFSRIGIFRAHVLIPNEIVTAGDLYGSYPGLTKTSMPITTYGTVSPSFRTEIRFSYGGSEAFRVVQFWAVTDTQVQVSTSVTAARTIWLQEASTFFQLNGFGSPVNYIRGYYSDTGGFHWSGDPWIPSNHQNAAVNTEHWAPETQAFYANPWGHNKWVGGNMGFRAMLDYYGGGMPNGAWIDCSIFGSSTFVEQAYTYASGSNIREWETAGLAPNWANVHLHGWTGGPGAVVCAPSATGSAASADTDTCNSWGLPKNMIYRPNTWRKLWTGGSISADAWLQAM